MLIIVNPIRFTDHCDLCQTTLSREVFLTLHLTWPAAPLTPKVRAIGAVPHLLQHHMGAFIPPPRGAQFASANRVAVRL